MKFLMFVVALFSFTACGPKAFKDGTYDDPNRVELLDDKFNEADMQQMAETIVDAILKCPVIVEAKGRPSVAVSKVVNRTEEYPDLDALTEMIRANLTKSRKVRFVDRGAREEIDSEHDYNESGRVAKDSAPKRGKQQGVEYLLSGALATNVQQVGKDKLIYYKLNMKLTNLEENVIECEEEKEIRKKYQKKSVGLF